MEQKIHGIWIQGGDPVEQSTGPIHPRPVWHRRCCWRSWPLSPRKPKQPRAASARPATAIAGRIREYWERNGGLPVFGFPITPLQQERVEGQLVQVQWFERNRLELHPENARPYDVLLGRIGAERLAAQQPNSAAKRTGRGGLPVVRRDQPRDLRRHPANMARQRAQPRQQPGDLRGREPGPVWPAVDQPSARTAEQWPDLCGAVVRARALRAAPRECAALPGAAGPAGPRIIAGGFQSASARACRRQRAHAPDDRLDRP